MEHEADTTYSTSEMAYTWAPMVAGLHWQQYCYTERYCMSIWLNFQSVAHITITSYIFSVSIDFTGSTLSKEIEFSKLSDSKPSKLSACELKKEELNKEVGHLCI